MGGVQSVEDSPLQRVYVKWTPVTDTQFHFRECGLYYQTETRDDELLVNKRSEFRDDQLKEYTVRSTEHDHNNNKIKVRIVPQDEFFSANTLKEIQNRYGYDVGGIATRFAPSKTPSSTSVCRQVQFKIAEKYLSIKDVKDSH